VRACVCACDWACMHWCRNCMRVFKQIFLLQVKQEICLLHHVTTKF